jgi:hypothetical protein
MRLQRSNSGIKYIEFNQPNLRNLLNVFASGYKILNWV